MNKLATSPTKRRSRKANGYGITRLDYLYTHGWWVRVPGHKQTLISDSRHGGRKRARKVAITLRDILIRISAPEVQQRFRNWNRALPL